jgi:tRNA(Ile)-lysidine synthase TilS/MesJ
MNFIERMVQENLNKNFPNIAKQIAALSDAEAEEEEEEEEEDEEEWPQKKEQDEQDEVDGRFRDPGSGDVTAGAMYGGEQLMDPSSEAESFNNVANGIAASLGLEQQQQQQHILLPHQSGRVRCTCQF